MDRSPEIARLLDASATALRAACAGKSLEAAERVIAKFESVGAPGGQPARLPVCDWIGKALDTLAKERAALGAAFADLEGKLRWAPRGGSEGAFRDSHANAMILGPGGLEVRSDLWIGATVMAPGVRYIDHDHAPEEVYLSLAPGEWWNAEMDWIDPGPEGAIYNPPGIRHAMRSGSGPFLALWYLPV